MRKNQRGVIHIALILIIVGLIGVVGFFAYKNSQPRELTPEEQERLPPIQQEATESCVQAGCNCLSESLAALAGIDLCADQQLPKLTCYDQATCERQGDGECGWTQTANLDRCLQQY